VHALARIRLGLARHPWAYWLVVSIVATTVAVSASRALAGIDEARRSWGEQDAVWVASAEIEPGQPIHADHRQVPSALVPESAVTVAPLDAVARQHIVRGAIITEVDVAAPGPAGLIPEGWVALAVPAVIGHFATGDHVRVYARDQFVASGVVVDRGDSEMTVAIPVDAAPAMAAALLDNTVTIALTADP
jgi:hypothetical protein